MNSSTSETNNDANLGGGDPATGTSTPAEHSESSLPLWPWAPLEVVALSAFAITQPLYSLLGANATFFVANDITGSSVTLFAVAVLVIPAVILAGIDLVMIQLPGRWARTAHASILGLLAALAVGVPLLKATGAQGALYIGGVLALAVLLTWLICRWQRIREAARWALFAPVLFLVAFLFASPVADVRSGQGPGSASADLPPTDTSVVMLVFDQLPLTMLLDPDGDIDAQWFPGFARLATESTWYPNTRALIARTEFSVPSLLTGQIPERGDLPVLSVHPDNLFTLLPDTHDVYADEYVTQMCPADVCGDQTKSSSTIWQDTAVVAVRTLLDERTADALVPRIDGRWNDFGTLDGSAKEARDWDEVREHRHDAAEDGVRFEQFLDSLGGVGDPERPDLSYLHLFQPHEPLRYLPDGTSHNAGGPFIPDDEGTWPNDVNMMDARLQQYIAQVMNADRQVSELLDRLEADDRLDDTILVVTSDHGVGTGPGMPNKWLPDDPDPVLLTEQLAVPLFIAVPGTTPGVDLTPVQLQDVLPTLLSYLGGTADLDFDGEPVDEVSDDRAPILLTDDGPIESPPFDSPTDSEMAHWIRNLMPEPAVPYVFGPAVDWFGTSPPDDLGSDPDVAVALEGVEELADVDTGSGYLPATVNATLTGEVADTEWLVTLNGVIAGGARPFEVDGVWHLSTLVDPSLFVDGANDVGFLVVAPDGLRSVSG